MTADGGRALSGRELLKRLIFDSYPEREAAAVTDGLDRLRNRCVSLRLNPLRGEPEKTLLELESYGLKPEQVGWYEHGYILPGAKEAEIVSLPAYLEGRIYLQSLSSMLPPIILKPNHNSDILDMAAAPGGKTTQLAALTQNRARITACEMNRVRCERLRFNLRRQGAGSVFVMETDSRRLDPFLSFDSILLDAPCSGSGTVALSESMEGFTELLIQKSVRSQKALLKKAVELIKPGGTIVYSTCSILPAENEEIVSEILSCGAVELDCIDAEALGLPTVKNRLEGTVTVLPGELYEGFFVARLKRKPGAFKPLPGKRHGRNKNK